MRIEHHVWYSPRLGHDMGVSVFGHWGPPLLAFPTSHGDEWELHRQGLIDAIGDFIDAGRVKVFCVGSNNHGVVPEQGRAPVPSQLAPADVRRVHPRGSDAVHLRQRQSPGIPISTMGASLGAYHAANTLFRYPHQVKRCYALSGIYDLRAFMGGMYDDNFYFHNPVDYMANLSDPWVFEQLASCEIRLVTGSGPVGEEPSHLRAVRRAGAQRDPPFRGRLGSAGRPRLAVLEGGDAGIHLVGRSVRSRSGVRRCWFHGSGDWTTPADQHAEPERGGEGVGAAAEAVVLRGHVEEPADRRCPRRTAAGRGPHRR